MKSSLLIHGCWLAAVVAAFAYGSMRSSSESVAIDSGSAQRATIGAIGAPAGASDAAGQSGPDKKHSNGDKALAGWSGSSRRPLTDVDIAELGRQFKNHLDPIQRRLAFARMLEGLTAGNAKTMREQIAHLGSKSAEFREFHYAWGAIGGEDAVWNGADTKQKDMAATLAGWASADPAAALQWLNGLDDSDKFNSRELKMGMVHGLANKDSALATDFVFQQAEAGDKRAEEMLGVVTGKVLQSIAPAAAADWAANLPDGALRASAMDRVAHDYVAKDPEAAAAWAERFAGEEHSARVIEEVGDEWAERDPASSVAWLESLEKSDGKSQGLRSALGEWVRKDPLAASQYLADMPTSPERDSAISGFASRLAWEDPASAITWAEEIADAGTRSKTLVQAGQALYHRDSDAARIWLPSSGLSAKAQEKILNPPRRHR